MFPVVALLLVGSYLSQPAIGQNCCADLPGIIAGIQAEQADLRGLVEGILKEVVAWKVLFEQLVPKVPTTVPPPKKCERRSDSDDCYKLILTKQTWFQSQQICEGLGGHLAFADSPKENNAIVAMIKEAQAKTPAATAICNNANGDLGQSFHIGARRDNCLQKFTWRGPGGAQTPVGFTDWNFRQPDCWMLSQGCSHICTGFGYHWDDIQCDKHAWSYACAVCEFDQF